MLLKQKPLILMFKDGRRFIPFTIFMWLMDAFTMQCKL
jgi:hypothetical protein